MSSLPSPPQAPTTQSSSSGYLNFLRLICINKEVVTKVLHFIFTQGSSSRPPHQSLLDFYRHNNNITFESGLFVEQRRKIDADPQGTTFDITLLYRCLRNGSHGLADKNDEKWRKDDGTSMESLLTLVKNRRNKLAHDEPKYTDQQMLNEAQEIRCILSKIIEFSGQIYNLTSTAIDTEIAFIESNIRMCLYENFQAKTLEEYKKQLFFDAQTDYANVEGVKETLAIYDSNLESEIGPVNHWVDLSLPLNKVYTDMTLKGMMASGQEQMTSYEEVLHDENQNKTKDVVVLSGAAGVGKSTFSKHMIQDWRYKEGKMKHLDDHNHLLKIECRNTAVKSFDDMLNYLMPNTSKNFQPGDFKRVILAQKLLVLLDGIDELNKSSAQLFDEILHLKKSHEITVLLTTRSVKLNYVEQKLKVNHIEFKHIQLLGIPSEKKEELVTKYHCEIAKKYPCVQSINGLLSYLKMTEHQLADLWRLPYNLSLLTILWAYKHMTVTEINTAPELYREFIELNKTKLKERLRSNEVTRALDETEINRIMDIFIYNLGKESLIGLMNNHINLPKEAYQRLQNICIYIEAPVEETMSSFLKRKPGRDNVYGFPHKGLQDFLAAYYLWLEITRRNIGYDFEEIEAIKEAFAKRNITPVCAQKIVESLEKEQKKMVPREGMLSKLVTGSISNLFPSLKASSIIHSILEHIHGSSSYDLPKFQNVFICLLGLFYSTKDVTIDERIKLETLLLLQGTGMSDRDAWITILNSVKCDEYVVSFISKKVSLNLEGHVQISDSSVSAYIALMKALKPPLKNADMVKIEIDIKGNLAGAHDLIEAINIHQFKIERILINENNIEEYTTMLQSLTTPIRDREQVSIDIQVDKELSEITDLLDILQKKRLNIMNLQVRKVIIHDGNLVDYTKALESLPTLEKGVFEGEVQVKIENKTSDVTTVLKEISRNQFTVWLDFRKDFKQPKMSDTHADVLSDVFQMCHVKGYTGKITSQIKEENLTQLENLYVSVPSTDDFLPLLELILHNRHRLETLCVSIPKTVEVDVMVPLSGIECVRLFLPDVVTEEDAKKAAEVVRRLNPTSGNKMFDAVLFPRCDLSPRGLRKMIERFEGVRVDDSLWFPSFCCPFSQGKRERMDDTARNTLGAEYGVKWGKPFWCPDGDIFDMDCWL